MLLDLFLNHVSPSTQNIFRHFLRLWVWTKATPKTWSNWSVSVNFHHPGWFCTLKLVTLWMVYFGSWNWPCTWRVVPPPCCIAFCPLHQDSMWGYLQVSSMPLWSTWTVALVLFLVAPPLEPDPPGSVDSQNGPRTQILTQETPIEIRRNNSSSCQVLLKKRNSRQKWRARLFEK